MITLIRRWLRRESGTTAIEFSMLLMPFLILTFGIIELSIMYTSANLLEVSTGSAARMIRTGQLQKSGSADPEADFRAAMCDIATALIDCNDIVIEVQVLNSYDDYSGPTYDGDGNMVPGGFETGGSNDRVMVRAAFRYDMITPLVGPLLSGGTGSRLFVSTIILQSEPYEFNGV